MVTDQVQAQIEAMIKTLNEAKSYSGLGPDDPSVIELERIILSKIGELAASSSAASSDRTSQSESSESATLTS